MAKFNQFSTENILMSVCGHLTLIAVLIASAAIVFDRAKLVAPDRIQIIEIDLENVKVSGDETKLYNVGVPEEKKEDKSEETKVKNEPEPVVKTEEIKNTTLVEDVQEKKEQDKEEVVKKTEYKKPTDKPKKKRVIKVNREVLSLDRTLTVSVVDALRVAMTRCWVVDNTRPDIADIRAVAHMKLRRNGTVQDLWFESAARAETDASFAYILETIKDAIDTCQPFRMLPPSEYEKWKDVQLTFYPSQGKVM
jgi:hypothetical protein